MTVQYDHVNVNTLSNTLYFYASFESKNRFYEMHASIRLGRITIKPVFGV